ncbi:uncharacterized protein [Hetaerina americana]|uniref:uncharacterized protein n=1 Tax=Hetaerina americana TaxID=62018 RepID=UPI003A7F3923
MKGFLIILFVAVLHHVNADGKCSCGTFLRSTSDPNVPEEGSRMYLDDSGHVDSCEGDAAKKACNDHCVDKIGSATNHGNLDWVRPKDGKSVGDLACTLLNRDVENRELAAFSKLCDGDWFFSKASTPQYLCCRGGRSIACS